MRREENDEPEVLAAADIIVDSLIAAQSTEQALDPVALVVVAIVREGDTDNVVGLSGVLFDGDPEDVGAQAALMTLAAQELTETLVKLLSPPDPSNN